MAAEKLTQREQVIRVSGLLMMVSPIFNFVFTVALADNVTNRWSWNTMWAMAKAGSGLMWLLSLGSVIVGAMMLKGRRSSWVSVLVLLGIFIVADALHFRKDLQSGWFQPTLSLATNLGLFILVYVQEFHQALAKYAPKRAPLEFTPARQILVAFDGFGPWAALAKVTMNEIHLCCLGHAPTEIEVRPLEMIFGDVLVSGTFANRNGVDYVFKFSITDRDLTIQLQNWLVAAIKRHRRISAQIKKEQSPALRTSA